MLGLKDNTQVAASAFAGMISKAMRERAARNAEPISIAPRPLPPNGDITQFPASNEVVVLERK